MKGKLMIGTHLRWMTLLKGKLTKKYKAFKLYKNNRMGSNFSNLQKLSQELSELTTKRKEDYNRHLANELNERQLSPKNFWKILKTFYNGNKIPLTTPIIFDKNLFQIMKENPIILINSLLLNAHPSIMILKFPTQLFSTQRWSSLPLLVKAMIYLKLSEILPLARPMVLMIYQSEWSS